MRTRLTYALPARFGSRAEMMAGFMRALAPPGHTPLVRTQELAFGVPKLALLFKGQVAALCEVAQMLTEPAWPCPLPLGRCSPMSPSAGTARANRAVRRAMKSPAGADRASGSRRRVSANAGRREFAARIVRERAGGAFDPVIGGLLADEATKILALDTGTSAWKTLACEPSPWLTLQGEAIDAALAAMGDFADLVSPYLVGHSAGVAELATAAARRCGLRSPTWSRFAGQRWYMTWGESRSRPHLANGSYDAGRLGTGQVACVSPSGFWPVPRFFPRSRRSPAVTMSDSTARLPSRSRGCGADPTGSATRRRRRLSRNDRAAAAPPGALARTGRRRPRPEARAGRLDAEVVAAVLEGVRATSSANHAAGGVDRARGRGGRPAGARLADQAGRTCPRVSVKTADRHVQNAYRKIGVSTRAAATLFAMQHGLATWGELISQPPAVRSVLPSRQRRQAAGDHAGQTSQQPR